MRIGVNCLSLQKDIGGLRQYFQRLFRELLSSDFDNSYIFFFTERNLSELELIGNDRWKELSIRVVDEGEIRLHLHKIDLYFCPFGVLSPRPLPIPSVLQLADIQEIFYPQFFTAEVLSMRKASFGPSTRCAGAVITLSEFSKNTIVEHHGIASEKIFVTRLVADSVFYQNYSLKSLDHLDLPTQFVFYPANHWQHKNHILLLTALKFIKEEKGVLIPAICTGLPMHNGFPLAEKIAEYGLSAQVRYVGYLSPEEMQSLYSQATLLCFPSLFEGFGMPVLEAMAAGCPVVCSNAASLPEVAGNAAIYFDPDDSVAAASAILRLWQDSELRDELIMKGRMRAAEFTAAAMAAVHLKAFEYAQSNFNYTPVPSKGIVSAITIATSIVPRNFELQRATINSWINLGIKVISLNSAEEVAIVSQNFPDVPINTVNRTAEAATGKPYVFFDDVRSALLDEPSKICGIVNSDIMLNADPNLADFIVETTGDGLLFGSRIDIDSMTNLDGAKFIYGFDFFFFRKEVLELFPGSDFCLGVPWWDYWAPLVPIVKGVRCRELISPVAFHLKHETKWASGLYCDYGKMFADKISQFSQHTDLACNVTNASSPEQLNVFSLDILQYILNNSDKVSYPYSEGGELRIEVGRLQYLSMREQVIEHRKKTCELIEQVKVANNESNPCVSEMEAIVSSISWRITKPLRWLGDVLRGIVKSTK